ncbi:type II toxin-antitoxin system RelE/ParE family toxin [Variovorax paradoxus]|jgi:toxin ParE1/3/4|uniref:type II toxin-antitoxin system RelE/ParE family toxin n=1 Tax=Variovorax paradoxus TaxID=34073 RepID=UPI0033974FFA
MGPNFGAALFASHQSRGGVAMHYCTGWPTTVGHKHPAVQELIKRNPDAGSPRLEVELGMPGLHSWRLSRHPYLIVYFRHPDFVDVVDVAHTRTDYVAALIRYLGAALNHPVSGEHRLS